MMIEKEKERKKRAKARRAVKAMFSHGSRQS